MEALPNSIPELIQKLNEELPEKTPEISWSDREIWIYSGQRKLINYLVRLQKEAEENILEN